MVGGEIPRLLRAHARTMGLTLRLLPRPLREPLGLGYLLARASDTIADSGRVATEERIAWLEGLASGERVQERSPTSLATFSPSERELLEALPGLLSMLGEHPDRTELRTLWRAILEGQRFDLRRFTSDAAPLDRRELEHYCDLVAGSVGRCWTRLIAKHAPRTLLAPVSDLLPLASAYGKGLQLVNILRDREADRSAGRFYVAEVGISEFLALAHEWLDAGEHYLSALRPGRILMATSLPLDLAPPTLAAVGCSPEKSRARITRGEVRAILLRNVASLCFPRRRNADS